MAMFLVTVLFLTMMSGTRCSGSRDCGGEVMAEKTMTVLETQTFAGICAGHYAALALTATFKTQAAWQTFYETEFGPLPYAKTMFGEEGPLAKAATGQFVSTFLAVLKEAEFPIYARAATVEVK